MLSYERQPGVVRALLLFGGLGMAVAPFLNWWVGFDLSTSEGLSGSGLGSASGNLVLIAGAATVLIALIPRFAPLGILTGLFGGAIGVLHLLAVMPWLTVIDFTGSGPDRGIVMALGGAALTMSGGIVGLSVAAAAQAHAQR
ncbi:MAG: hypothetical protein GEU71_16945 [Actinobacteria bacterium]|nr:hypothetical protein [Actinomycetota bacterium]